MKDLNEPRRLIDFVVDHDGGMHELPNTFSAVHGTTDGRKPLQEIDMV
jgi:hypothetical protein